MITKVFTSFLKEIFALSIQSQEISRYFTLNGIKQRDAAEAVGVNESSMSNILAGRYKIGRKMAFKFKEAFGFDPIFLLTGEGGLFTPRIDQSHNEGAIVNENCGTINVTAANAALQAENARLRDEVAWLRSELAKKQ